MVFTARRSYASTVLGVVILSVSMSVRPSVIDLRVLCDKTKQCTANVLTPHERAITPVLRLKYALKVTVKLYIIDRNH